MFYSRVSSCLTLCVDRENMKSKILISIMTLILSSIVSVIILNTFWVGSQYSGLELWKFYFTEVGYVVIRPVLSPINIYWEQVTPKILFALAILTAVWFIYFFIKSKSKWSVIFPLVVWIVISSTTWMLFG